MHALFLAAGCGSQAATQLDRGIHTLLRCRAQADGVDTQFVLRAAGAPSPFTYIIVDRQGMLACASSSSFEMVLVPQSGIASSDGERSWKPASQPPTTAFLNLSCRRHTHLHPHPRRANAARGADP